MSKSMYLPGADERAIARMKANAKDYETALVLASIVAEHANQEVQLRAARELDDLIGRYLDMEAPAVIADNKPKYVWRNGARVKA